MKHILPEGMLRENIMAHDKKTLCMESDLKITRLHDVVLSGKDKVSKVNNTIGLRKVFLIRPSGICRGSSQVEFTRAIMYY